MPVYVELMGALYEVWQRASPQRREEPDRWAERLSMMQHAQASIMAHGGWSHGPSTLLSVLGISRREVANCRVIRWLLDPLARHGIGAGLITALGEAIGCDLAKPAQARAEVEVSCATSRADVVLTGAGEAWTVVIEAKIAAAEGLDQGGRLEHDWLNDEEAGSRTHLVFLTLDGRRLPRTARLPQAWTPMAWGWFADAAQLLLDGSPVPGDARAVEARHAVREWLATVKRSLR